MSTVVIDLIDVIGQRVACDVTFEPLDTPFLDGEHRLRVSPHRNVTTGEDGRASIVLAGGNYRVRIGKDEVTIGVPDDQATYPLGDLINSGVTPPLPPVLQGPPGSRILSAARDPLMGEGAVGDFFLNTAGKTFYGPKGASGWPTAGIPLEGPQGASGLDGVDGREVEFQKGLSHIEWRYAGDALWNELVLLSELKGDTGDTGREVELQVHSAHIQWRYAGSSSWTNLISMAELTGDQGEPGPLNEFDHLPLSGTVLTGVKDSFFYKSIAATTAFTFSAFGNGRVLVLRLTTVGSAQPSWPGGIEWPGGYIPQHPSGSTVYYQFIKVNGVISGIAVPVAVPGV